MSILNPVKSGESLSAAKENQKIATINELSDRLNSLHLPNQKNGGIICTILNNTGSTITTGYPLSVTGIRNEVDKDKLISLYLKSGIQLEGETVTAQSTVIAFTLESAKDGKLARCFLPGCFGGLVTIKADSHKYAKPKADGIESSPYGNFFIIGKSTRPTNISSESDYEGFGILKINEMGGHLVGTLLSDISGGSRADVTVGSITIPRLTCPLLRENETISAGMNVILSWNALENELQIIEAECEGEEEGE
jgi:hypothetical protein